MAIYGRSGAPVTFVRVALLSDVKSLDGRKPDKQDREAIANGSYVVVKDEDGKERLYHQAFLRADGGSREISQAIESDPYFAAKQPDKRWQRWPLGTIEQEAVRIADLLAALGGKDVTVEPWQAMRDELEWRRMDPMLRGEKPDDA